MNTVNLKINNIPVVAPEGATILEAAHLAGIRIPTLCYLKEINAIGACRICVCEVKGARGLAAACVMPVNEGMEVFTNTPTLQRYRRTTLELILSTHRTDCLSCSRSTDCELQQLCREYLSVNLVFCWGIFLQTYGQRLLQAVGDTVLSMVSLIIGAVANIILDPIMIFGLLGCPAMGIRGAAIATVIGQLIGAAAALWFNRVKNPVIHVRLKGYCFLWQYVADIYRVGLPTIVMQAIGSVMTFAVNGILLGVSSTAVAFFGIYYKLQNFLMMPVNGLGQAAIPVVGFNYGSGQSDRVKQAWKVLLPTGVVFALCGTAVFLLFPAQLLGLFSASDEMLAFGVPALRIISMTFLFAVITILCGYFASGLGNGVVNMIGAALRQLVVLVPCLWLLIRTMGIEKAWFAFWVSEVAACAYSLWATKKELRNKGK